MATSMKVCTQCALWFSGENDIRCPRCGNELKKTRLSDIYWGKCSEQDKLEYTKEYCGKYYSLNYEQIKKQAWQKLLNYFPNIVGRTAFINTRQEDELFASDGKYFITCRSSQETLAKAADQTANSSAFVKRTVPLTDILYFKKDDNMVSFRYKRKKGITVEERLPELYYSAFKQVIPEKEYEQVALSGRMSEPAGSAETDESLSIKETRKPDVPDKFDEIKKYKELMDLGIITAEEFAAKRQELLGF